MPGAPGPVDAAVWYAAYGSNLAADRFALYVQGGTHPTTGRVTPGCRDPRPPAASVAATLEHRVVFARHSTGWDGAVAFLDADGSGMALVRLWRITLGQLVDVVAQENVARPGTVDGTAVVGLGRRRPTCSVIAGGWYGRVLWCGERDGAPVLTCTADWDLAAEVPAPPAPAYVATMGQGLRELGHGAGVVADYLASLPGMTGPALAALAVDPTLE